jgi:hypothetical protein
MLVTIFERDPISDRYFDSGLVDLCNSDLPQRYVV